MRARTEPFNASALAAHCLRSFTVFLGGITGSNRATSTPLTDVLRCGPHLLLPPGFVDRSWSGAHFTRVNRLRR